MRGGRSESDYFTGPWPFIKKQWNPGFTYGKFSVVISWFGWSIRNCWYLSLHTSQAAHAIPLLTHTPAPSRTRPPPFTPSRYFAVHLRMDGAAVCMPKPSYLWYSIAIELSLALFMVNLVFYVLSFRLFAHKFRLFTIFFLSSCCRSLTDQQKKHEKKTRKRSVFCVLSPLLLARFLAPTAFAMCDFTIYEDDNGFFFCPFGSLSVLPSAVCVCCSDAVDCEKWSNHFMNHAFLSGSLL